MPEQIARLLDPAWLVPAVIAVLLLVPRTRSLLGPVTTIYHEFGHALVGVLFGARVAGIRVFFDGSGEARLAHPPGARRRIGRAMSLWAGYLTPPLTGMGLLALVLLGREPWPLAATAAVGLAVLLFIRNWQGLLVMLLYLGALALAAIDWLGFGDGIVSGIASLLIIGGVLDLLRTGPLVVRGRRETDFHFLARESRLPFPPLAHYAVYCLVVAALLAAAGAGIVSLLPR